jgi:hypothetical protein
MPHEIRNRIIRAATPEEKERHEQVRDEIERELPQLKQWAREAAARHRDRVAIGTVFSAEESNVVAAIDDFALKNSFASRADVVREALARLLGVEISVSRQQAGDTPGS